MSRPSKLSAPLLAGMWRLGVRIASATVLERAMILTVLGWAMMWAEALRIVTVVPLPWTIAMFGLGLALIPFASGERVKAPPRPT
jgi:hypothetical protein